MSDFLEQLHKGRVAGLLFRFLLLFRYIFLLLLHFTLLLILLWLYFIHCVFLR